MKTLTDILSGFTEYAASYAATKCQFVTDKIASWAESPIEAALGAAIYCRATFTDGITEIHFCGPTDIVYPHFADQPFPGEFIFQQAKCGSYRADFLYLSLGEGGSKKWIAIECDGHDFHERTKEQAARDKSRDRWFAIEGIQVVRFTGSEIWKDPLHCADQFLMVAARVNGWLDYMPDEDKHA